MAQAVLTDSQLRITYEAGLDGDGEMQYKSKNYNYVKLEATADELFNAAQAIVGLQSLVLKDIERNDSSILTV